MKRQIKRPDSIFLTRRRPGDVRPSDLLARVGRARRD
jgi:hypothetical protein